MGGGHRGSGGLASFKTRLDLVDEVLGFILFELGIVGADGGFVFVSGVVISAAGEGVVG